MRYTIWVNFSPTWAQNGRNRDLSHLTLTELFRGHRSVADLVVTEYAEHSGKRPEKRAGPRLV